MSTSNERSVFFEVVARHRSLFTESWPFMVAGLLIAIMSIITFAWARPWGVAGGLKNWGDWFFYATGFFDQAPSSPWVSSNAILTLGLLWGAFASALLSKEFAFQMAPPLELVKGIVGGSLMGIGSSMAGGCNVGGFYMALSAFSLSGLAMMVGLILGAYVGLRYLLWELERFPSKASTASEGAGKGGLSLRGVEPYLGVVVLLGALAMAWAYSENAYTSLGGLLLCGIAFGIIIQRTRFCFVRGFRDPFMTGEGIAARAIALSIIVSAVGFAVLKWTGLRGEMVYVPKAFWFGALAGGTIFGFGMVVAGGCGSGSVWRAGEGQIKLILAVLFFSLSLSLFEAWTAGSEALTALMGSALFLPHVIGYKWSLIGVVLLMLLYYILATWNEETNAFTVEL